MRQECGLMGSFYRGILLGVAESGVSHHDFGLDLEPLSSAGATARGSELLQFWFSPAK